MSTIDCEICLKWAESRCTCHIACGKCAWADEHCTCQLPRVGTCSACKWYQESGQPNCTCGTAHCCPACRWAVEKCIHQAKQD